MKRVEGEKKVGLFCNSKVLVFDEGRIGGIKFCLVVVIGMEVGVDNLLNVFLLCVYGDCR